MASNSEENELFLQYCHDDDLEKLGECLARGVVDVNTLSERQWTGLIIACTVGNPAIVSTLVEVPGLDIDYQDVFGHSAAHRASIAGHTECVRILADSDRVDWNKKNEYNITPLYWAIDEGHVEIVDIIVKQPNLDCNVKTVEGETLAHAAVRTGDLTCVETLAAEENFDCWNLPDSDGDTAVMKALEKGKPEIVKILLNYSRVDLSFRDARGWSPFFRAIQMNKLGRRIIMSIIDYNTILWTDLLEIMLPQLSQTYTGSSLARIAVEVGEEEDIRLLMKSRMSKTFDWNEIAEGEDPAILWALKNGKFGIVDILTPVTKINLEGDPSADLSLKCDSETFRVHKHLLCSKSLVFNAMLNADMREAREGEIEINDMNSDTLSAMIHYFYTGKMTQGWRDLDIQDVAKAADQYDLSGWMRIFCFKLNQIEAAEKVADMLIAGSRYQHNSAARRLTDVAKFKLKERREIAEDPAFREKLGEEDPRVLSEIIVDLVKHENIVSDSDSDLEHVSLVDQRYFNGIFDQ